MDKTERVRAASRKYYAKNAHDIIKKKTLQKVRSAGRNPRTATLVAHEIDTTEIATALQEYIMKRHECI